MKAHISIVAIILVAGVLGGCKWPGSSPPAPPASIGASGTLSVGVAFAGPAAGGPKWSFTVADTAAGAGVGFHRLIVDLAKSCQQPVFPKSPFPHVYPEHGPSAHWVFDYIMLATKSTFSFSCDAADGGKATVESLVTSGNTVVSRLGPVTVDGPK